MVDMLSQRRKRSRTMGGEGRRCVKVDLEGQGEGSKEEKPSKEPGSMGSRRGKDGAEESMVVRNGQKSPHWPPGKTLLWADCSAKRIVLHIPMDDLYMTDASVLSHFR